MQLVKQPTSSTCGQACLAMVLGMSLQQAIRVVGHSDVTTPDELLDCLSTITGLPHYVTFGTPPMRGVYICYHKELEGPRAHWTVLKDGVRLDPAQIRRSLWDVERYIEVRS